MKGYKLEQIREILTGSHSALIAASFIFIIGISAGIFLEIAMEPAEKAGALHFLKLYLNNTDSTIRYPNPFLPEIRSNLFLLAISMLSGLVTIGFPAAYAVTLYKGMVIGFSVGLLIESYAFSAILPIVISILPQNIILVPSFIFAAAASQNYSLATDRLRRSPYKKSSRVPAVGLDCYITAYLILAFFIISGCLIEAVVFILTKV